MTRASTRAPAGLPHAARRLSPAVLRSARSPGAVPRMPASGEARSDALLVLASCPRGDRRHPVTRRTALRTACRIQPGPCCLIRAGVAAGSMTGGGCRPGETYAPAPRQRPVPARGRDGHHARAAQADPRPCRSAARLAGLAAAGSRWPGRDRVPIGRLSCPIC
jgi:hypothetical protein